MIAYFLRQPDNDGYDDYNYDCDDDDVGDNIENNDDDYILYRATTTIDKFYKIIVVITEIIAKPRQSS